MYFSCSTFEINRKLNLSTRFICVLSFFLRSYYQIFPRVGYKWKFIHLNLFICLNDLCALFVAIGKYLVFSVVIISKNCLILTTLTYDPGVCIGQRAVLNTFLEHYVNSLINRPNSIFYQKMRNKNKTKISMFHIMWLSAIMRLIW